MLLVVQAAERFSIDLADGVGIVWTNFVLLGYARVAPVHAHDMHGTEEYEMGATCFDRTFQNVGERNAVVRQEVR
jgi:hypothetical protein